MLQIRKILLVADPAMRRTPAFERAAALARRSGASLHILIAEYSEPVARIARIDPAAMEQAREGLLRARRAWLADEAAALRGQGLTVTADAVWAHPAWEAVVQHAVELSPDLVVKDVCHEPLYRRLLYTPADRQLLRLCPVPLLLVNSVAHAAPRRVIAAIDPLRGSDGEQGMSRRIVDAALALSTQCDADLHLAHAFDGLGSAATATPTGMQVLPSEVYEILRKSHEDAFRALADAYGVPEAKRHFLDGPPAQAIADFASETGTDLVVIGSSRRGGMDRFIMGDTAEALADRVSSSVLVIRPEGFAREIAARLEEIQSR